MSAANPFTQSSMTSSTAQSLDASDTLTVKQYGISSLSDLTLSIAGNSELQFRVHKVIVAQHSTYFQHLVEGDRDAKEIELVSDMSVTAEELDLFLQTIYGQIGSYLKSDHAVPYFTVDQLVQYQERPYKVMMSYRAGQSVTLLPVPIPSESTRTYSSYGYGGLQFYGNAAFGTSQPQRQQQPQPVEPSSTAHFGRPPTSASFTFGAGPQQSSLFASSGSTCGSYSFYAPAADNQPGQRPSSQSAALTAHTGLGDSGQLSTKTPMITVDERQLARENNLRLSSQAACDMAERLLPVASYLQALNLLNECYSVIQTYFNVMTAQQKLSWLSKFDQSHNEKMLNALLQQITPFDLQEAAAFNESWYKTFRADTVGKLLQRAVNRPQAQHQPNTSQGGF